MKLDTNDFIKRCNKIHNKYYDYSLVDYINNRTKVKIICPIHGVFEQNAGAHMRGQKCKECVKNNIKSKSFINDSKKIHNNKYNYSLVDYINNKTKVKIICPIHGIFEQLPYSHLHGHGCKQCSILEKQNKFKINTNDFIKDSEKIHGDKYDYSLVKYINNKTKVKIICPIHGIFEQNPYSHKSGLGCYMCKESFGENVIRQYLDKRKIKYSKEKTFDDCKFDKNLRFDFYLYEHNMCIEFDGIQHFESVDYWGGDESLKLRQKRDKIKNKYCVENDIKLLRIRYDDDIFEKLNINI